MYMIYCDTNTLVNCTEQQLDEIIKSNTGACVKINSNVWFIDSPKKNYMSCLHSTEDFFHDCIEQFTDKNTVFVITEIDNDSSFYNLPEEITVHCQTKNHN